MPVSVIKEFDALMFAPRDALSDCFVAVDGPSVEAHQQALSAITRHSK